MSRIATYNTHYEAYAEMLGKPNIHSVFEHILDIYSRNIRAGKTGPVVISFNEIARKRHISKSTVPEIIKLLEATKIIGCSKDDEEYNGSTLCRVDADRFVSLILAFIELNNSDKKKFTKALYDEDEEILKLLGYTLIKNAGKKLSEQKGNYDFLGGTILSGVSQNSTICPNIVPSVLKQYHLSQYSTTCPNVVPPFKDNSTVDGTILGHLYPEMVRNSTTSIKKLVDNLGKGAIKNIFEEVFSHSNEENIDKNAFFEELDEILDFPEQISLEKAVLWWYYFGTQVVLYWDRGGTILGHSNNIIINNKKEINKEKEVLLEKNQNISSNSSSTQGNFGNDIFQGKNEEFIDFNFLKEVLENKNYERSTPSYQDLKNKSRLPYFPVEEIENIITDPSNCLDRPDKIFINRVWECLLPFFISDQEGENEEMVESQQDPEGMPFYVDRIIQDIITPAFQETQDIISSGNMNIRGIDLPVTASELNPDDVQRILDFELAVKGDDRVYIISKKSFRNIFADPIPVTPKRAAKEGREEDKAYMQEIVLLGDDDERYKDLTPIELVIYNFLNDYFKINEDGSVEAPLQKFVNRVSLGRFYLSVTEKGLTEKDFLSVLFNNAPDRQTGSLTLKPRMFSSVKIKEWNAIKGYESKIEVKDNKSLDKTEKISKIKEKQP